MKYDQKQTEKWIKLIKQNDEQAYGEFYEYWYPKSFYIALSIMRNETDAKDAAQESMIEIHKSIHNLRDVAYFKLWLNRIICSKCNRIFRKRKDFVMNKKNDTRLENMEEERSYLLPEQANHYATDQEVLHTLIDHIPYMYREVLSLMYFEHMSIKEISYCLQIPEGTVKSRLSTAKAKLKEEIIEYEHKSEVRLNFKETTLETLLIASYANYCNKYGIAKSAGQHVLKSKPMALSIKAMVLTASCIGTLIVGATAFSQMGKDHQSQSTQYSAPKQVNQTNFPVITFKKKEIQSAKDAYFVLKQYAHCEYELQQLSEEEQAELKNIEDAMLENSKIYTDLYKK